MSRNRPTVSAAAVLVAVACLAAGGRESLAQSGWLPTSWFAPSASSSIAADEMFPLSEKDGPWLVFATTFRGDGAREDARRLVQELRGTHKLEAFTHEKSFDYTGRPKGLGLNPDGTPKRMRYANAEQVKEIAVLVGSFATVDDPRAQKVLAKVKSLEPQSLSGQSGRSRAFSDFKRSMGLAATGKGPLKLAFMIPNPLLPEEFFAQTSVDQFVLDMNSDVEHSLLECPGRYTVRVAVFTGAGTVDQKKIESGTAAEDLGNRLVQAAEKAHTLTLALRRRGHIAWEFHDRESSIVCVGSFEAVAGQGPDGREVVNPAVARVVADLGPDREKLASGVVVPRSIDGIMLEIDPKPIEVPKLAARGRPAR
jgi:hypothetical protein